MKHSAPPLALTFALGLLAACDAPPAETGDRIEAVDLEDLADAQPLPPPPPSPPPPSPPPRVGDTAVGVNDGIPDLTPAALTPEAERTETGARNVLVNWARAIELQEWDQAWAMMSAADQRRWSKAQFAASFADLSDVTVAVPGGTMARTAGLSIYSAPVTITGTDAAGRPVRYEGEVELRRVDAAPGADTQQQGWRIERTTLDWTH